MTNCIYALLCIYLATLIVLILLCVWRQKNNNWGKEKQYALAETQCYAVWHAGFTLATASCCATYQMVYDNMYTIGVITWWLALVGLICSICAFAIMIVAFLDSSKPTISALFIKTGGIFFVAGVIMLGILSVLKQRSNSIILHVAWQESIMVALISLISIMATLAWLSWQDGREPKYYQWK